MSETTGGASGEIGFTVGGRIAKPVHEVFEAVVDPQQRSQYARPGDEEGPAP